MRNYPLERLFSPAQRFNRIVLLSLGSALLVFLGLIASLPLQMFCDASEYLGMSVSLLRTHNLSWERADLEGCAEVVPPETYIPDLKIGTLVRKNRHGDMVWGTHSIYYSVIALPFVALMGAKGFLVMNALCFLMVFFLLYKYLCDENPPTTSLALAVLLVGLSSAISYVFWIHSETLVFAASFSSFYFALRRRSLLAGLALGVAVAIKPMFCLQGVSIFLLCARSRRDILPIGTIGAVASVVALPQVVYNYVQFGSWNSLEGWVSLSYVSLGRVLALWVDPAEGMFWFYPGIMWCLLRNRWPWYIQAAHLVTVLLMSVTFTVGSPFNTHQVGWRYCLFLFPFFLVMVGQWRGKAMDWAAALYACLLGGVLLLNAVGNSGAYAARFNLSERMFELIGVSSYPERFFNTPNRLSRDIAISRYFDNNRNIRSRQTLFQVRNAKEGNIVLKLFSPEGRGGGEVNLRAASGPPVTAELRDGKVSTLVLPLTTGQFKDYLFHDLRNRRVPVARLRLISPLKVVSGSAEFYWQRRWFASQYPGYLYMAGPIVIDFYAPASRILAAVASEDITWIEKSVIQPDGTSTGQGPSPTEDSLDFLEGAHSLRYLVENPKDTGSFSWALRTTLIQLPEELEKTEIIMTSGWLKYTADSPATKAVIAGTWLRADKSPIASGSGEVPGQTPSVWFRVREQWKPPDGSAYLQVYLGLSGKGQLKVDDLIISRHVPPW